MMSQEFATADSGQLKYLGRLHGAAADQDLSARLGSPNPSISPIRDSGGPLSGELHPFYQCVGLNVQHRRVPKIAQIGDGSR